MVYWLGIIFSIVMFIVIIIFVIIMAHLQSKESKTQVTPNKPELLIYSKNIRSFTDSYFKGIVKTQKERKNGTTFIEFYPTDVEQGEGVPIPDLQFFVIKNEFIKRFTEGELSGRRQTIIILPRSRMDLPSSMRETLEDKWLTREGQLAYIRASVGDVLISQGDEAVQEALKEYSRTGIGKMALAEIKERATQQRKVIEGPTESKEEPRSKP